MQQKQQELEQQTYLRMQKQMQRQTQTMPVQRAGMSYQTGIPTGESTMSGERAAATSGHGMSRPAYGIPAGDATAATGTAGECTDPTVSAATHFADTGGRTVYVYGAQGTPGRSLPVFDTTWYRVSHSLRCRKDMIS